MTVRVGDLAGLRDSDTLAGWASMAKESLA